MILSLLLYQVWLYFVVGRDGVSEGQFSQVLLHEMDAIRKVKVNRILDLN